MTRGALRRAVNRAAQHGLASVAIFFFALLAGCSRESEPQVVDRNRDPIYVKQLTECRAEQKKIAHRAGEIARALEAACAEDPNSAKAKELEKQHLAVSEELEKNRILSMALIRERMQKEQADRKAAKGQGK